MTRKTFSYSLNIRGPEGFSTRFEIPIGITIISRQAGVGLQLDNKYISRRHARLECIDTECHITDLGSDNGTYVNGAKLSPQTPILLNHNDRIKIGPYEFEVEKIETSPEPEIPITPAEIVVPKDVPKSIEEPSIPTTPPPLPPDEDLPPAHISDNELVPPGLSIKSKRLLSYLPSIYHSDFMARFLGIFEAILTPIEWNIDNFDLFLSPQTCPSAFLPWLANWFEAVFDDSWDEMKRRTFLREAHQIYACRGTKRALSRTLEIYTGYTPEIDDLANDLEPHTFRVHLPMREKEVRRTNIEALINAHKPAHTAYELHFQE